MNRMETNFFGLSIILYLALAAISFLFLGIMGAFIYSRVTANQPDVSIPILFYVSTIIIIGVSFVGQGALAKYKDSDFSNFQRLWTLLFILLILFIVIQFLGWRQLLAQGLPASANNSIGYLYVLSALHMLHIVIGFPFHIKEMVRQYLAKKQDEFSQMEYISNELIAQRLALIVRYWHFLDGLWILLLLFFILQANWSLIF